MYPTEIAESLENNFQLIRAEVLALLESRNDFILEPESLHDKGEWKLFRFVENGTWHDENGRKAPQTFSFLKQIHELSNCIPTKNCDAFLSRMKPGTHVSPHCGPTNLRIRVHLGVVVPDGCAIRVGNETRFWEEGKVMVFDDSFEHEVWHRGMTDRIVLILDLWHPAVPQHIREPKPKGRHVVPIRKKRN